jgi:hypothetical protein
MFEKKKLAKRRAEEEKEARKQKHIEAKEKEDKLVPAVTTYLLTYLLHGAESFLSS